MSYIAVPVIRVQSCSIQLVFNYYFTGASVILSFLRSYDRAS